MLQNKNQVEILNELAELAGLPGFAKKLAEDGLDPLTATNVEIFQINLGRLCNQVCKHCHVNAGPNRTEIMTRETMEECLSILKKNSIPLVDLTGGAPEMNPHFRWFIEELSKLDVSIIDRCNLTILSEPGQEDLAEFLARHKIEIIASLPGLNGSQTDSQRGKDVYSNSLKGLKQLNSLGYGKNKTDLILNLITNPVGAFLPGTQSSIEKHWKKTLFDRHEIVFNNLYTITNMPLGRFLNWLVRKDLLQMYIEKLISNYNPIAAKSVMCRNTISVDWQGYMYDCDFNQMLDLKVNHGLPTHISEFDMEKYSQREIVTELHCFGCTAGCGSSCGGATTE
jgi:radical SAM/Cys-rich protein